MKLTLQQSLELKNTEQRKALKAWQSNNFIGSVFAGTGFGKSRVGVLAAGEVLRKWGGKALVLVPTNQLQDQFEEEFKKWGYDDILPDVEIVCYQSACKYENKHYEVIIADEVHLGLSDVYIQAFTNNTYNKLLCLTATPPEDPTYLVRLQKLAPIVYHITMDQCVKMGLISPYEIYCIPVELTTEEKKSYSKANNMFVQYKYRLGQFEAFDEANQILANPSAYTREEYTDALMFYKAIRDRKDVVQKAYNKILYASKLIGYHDGSRILTFAGNNEITDAINAQVQKDHGDISRVYHSKLGTKARKQALEDFKNKTANVLCSTKALNQGFDVSDAEIGIICGLDSKSLSMIQRVGRLLRLSPNKIGKVIILYVADSQEEKWLRSSIKSFNNIVWIDKLSSYICIENQESV